MPVHPQNRGARQTTLQQFRECVTGEEGYRFVIHDRDRIFSGELDQSLKSLGLTVLKTPYKSPQANAFCERLMALHDESVWTL
jgi:putative transposase